MFLVFSSNGDKKKCINYDQKSKEGDHKTWTVYGSNTASNVTAKRWFQVRDDNTKDTRRHNRVVQDSACCTLSVA